MAKADDPRTNRLLACLPDEQWQRWLPHLEPVTMALGDVLYRPGSKQSHVYFPTTAVVSLLYVMENGDSPQIAMVGNEGVVGISLFMGGQTTSSSALVQAAGAGYRLTSALLMEEFNRGGPVLHLLLRYTQALITQMAQTSVCNRHHSLDQQLCRWLLLTMDRTRSTEVVMTHELLATMLGVRRASISEAAGNLQRDGLMRYERGRIGVLDRNLLQQRACECYAVVKTEYDRLLPTSEAT
jgi:CRP-like cAMP-binding protein